MKIILASKSPRRVEILSRYINDFEIRPSEIDEKTKGESPELVAMSNAFEKAWNIAKDSAEDIVIGSDTVVFNGKVLGKPKNKEEAKEMLRSLSGKEHSVITGISIINLKNNVKVVDYEISKVKFRILDDITIDNYLQYDEYEDKAGSYAIQGKGEVFCEKFEGSFSNIVGLPIMKLDILLKKYFKKGLL